MYTSKEQRTVGGEFGCRSHDLGTRAVFNTASAASRDCRRHVNVLGVAEDKRPKKHTYNKNEIRKNFYLKNRFFPDMRQRKSGYLC